MADKKADLQKESQEKYFKFEILNKEFEQVYNQLGILNSRLSELKLLKEALKEIKKGQSFSQLGSGIFVPSEIKDDNKLLVDIGRRLFVNMTKKEAEGYLGSKIESFESVILKVSERRDELQKEIQSLLLELQGLEHSSED